MLQASEFDTSQLALVQRAPLWHEVVCKAFVRLDCKPARNGFHAKLFRQTLDDASITTIAASSQRVERTRKLISASGEAHCIVSLAVSGVGQVTQDGRQTIHKAGDLVIYDTRRPYCLEFGQDFAQINFMMTIEALKRRLVGYEQLTAVSLAGGDALVDLVGTFLSKLPEATRAASPQVRVQLAKQAADLVALVLAERSGRGGSSTTHRTALLLRIKEHVEHRLHDPALKRDGIAREFRISTRYLDELFQEEQETVSSYVLARRLEWCRDVLEDPKRGRLQIGEIAHQGGFVSQAHFSRSFSETFGMSPRMWRKSRPGGRMPQA